MARDIHNEKVPVHSPLAVSWCAAGAVLAAIRNEFDQEAFFKRRISFWAIGHWEHGMMNQDVRSKRLLAC